MRTADPVVAVTVELLDKGLMRRFCLMFIYPAQAEVQNRQNLRRSQLKVLGALEPPRISEASSIWRSIISS